LPGASDILQTFPEFFLEADARLMRVDGDGSLDDGRFHDRFLWSAIRDELRRFAGDI